MRVVHNSAKKLKLTKEPDEDWRDIAKQYEEDKAYAEAMEAYHQDLKVNAAHENSWHRLMILYRKEGNLKMELQVLDDAIAVFENLYSPGNKKAHGKKVTELSRALMKSTGLADKKGKPIHYPEPLGKWYRRREIVKKKTGTKSK
ncbi:MAG: hypothetical protein EOO09_21090 [Chitinophagaceae bacterium]|nr:MAG: hypothetical protein EOO09_21090 [Chitinophagaceae bacterium]